MLQFGEEIKDEDLPADMSDLYYESQLAFLVYSYLPERWEGMSATYLGKDTYSLPFLFDLFEIQRPEQLYIVDVIRLIDAEVGQDIRAKQKAASQSKSKGNMPHG